MAAFKITGFGGIAPKVDPAQLAENMATTADNVRLDRAALVSLNGTKNALTISNTAKSIYKFLNYWFWWVNYGVDVIRSPVPNDLYNRLYWTGDSYPKYCYSKTSYNIPAPLPINIPAQPNSPGDGDISYTNPLRDNISSSTSSATVTNSGLGDGFNFPLIGYYLFEYSTGTLIGQIKTVESSSSLTLSANAAVTYTGLYKINLRPGTTAAGTIAAAEASANITGTSTSFNSGHIGQYLIAALTGDVIGQIQSVASSTGASCITLNTLANASYVGTYNIQPVANAFPGAYSGISYYNNISIPSGATALINAPIGTFATGTANNGYFVTINNQIIGVVKQTNYSGQLQLYQSYLGVYNDSSEIKIGLIESGIAGIYPLALKNSPVAGIGIYGDDNLTGTIVCNTYSAVVILYGSGAAFSPDAAGKYLIQAATNTVIGLVLTYNSATQVTLSSNAAISGATTYIGGFYLSTQNTIVEWRYFFTYVDQLGQESPACSALSIYRFWPNNTFLRLYLKDSQVSGPSSSVTTIRIYRTKAASLSVFYKLKDIAITVSGVIPTQYFDDTTPDASLGAAYSAPYFASSAPFTWYYIETFIDALGHEGLASNPVAITSTTGASPLLQFTDTPGGWTSRRIYRGTGIGTYEKMLDLAASTTQYFDIITSLGADYVAPGFNPTPTHLGVSDVNPDGWLLGTPAPTVKPGVTLVGSGSGTAVYRNYVYTYVAPLGEEGPPSPASNTVTWYTGDTVTITFTDTPPTSYNLAGSGTDRRLYRAITGGSTTKYQYVADIPVGTTTYSDSILDANLGEVLPSANYYPPPQNMIGIKIHPAGFAVGFFANTLFVSELFLPHAWNPSNQIALQGNIIAIAITGDSILVLTDYWPYLVTGTTPSSLSAIKIDVMQTCVSKQGVADLNGLIMFGSPDGLVSDVMNDMRVATLNLLMQYQWQAWNPASLKGFFHEGFYIGFTNTNAFMIDMRYPNPTLSTCSALEGYIAGYNDLASDNLYLLDQSGNIDAWEQGSPLTGTWTSKPFRVQEAICPAAVRAYFTGTLTFTLLADGIQVCSFAMTSGVEQRLPAGYLAKQFQVALTLNGIVESVTVATSIQELE